MRAVVVDPNVEGRLKVADVEAPEPGFSEALVRVKAVSLNRGEIRAAMGAGAGHRPGWDVAGTVEREAADGSGPRVGSRVFGFMPKQGGWAEFAAVSTNALAEIPDGVSFEDASTLPVAGITALRCLERGGLLTERTVMISGASGGVGIFACQIARSVGARVVGVVHRAESEAAARAAGAQEVVVGEDLEAARKFGPYNLIVDSVGGAVLGQALAMLAKGGTCVVFGATGGDEVTFDLRTFYNTGGASLQAFIVFYEHERDPVAGDLARLAGMLAEGRLRPHIDVRGTLDDVARIARLVTERSMVGKAVLRV
ncbi:MAG TPA: zinc-binding dehydrogenase [Chloroflexota bacterium]